MEDDIEVTSSDLIIEFRGKIERGDTVAMGFAWFATGLVRRGTGSCVVAVAVAELPGAE